MSKRVRVSLSDLKIAFRNFCDEHQVPRDLRKGQWEAFYRALTQRPSFEIKEKK